MMSLANELQLQPLPTAAEKHNFRRFLPIGLLLPLLLAVVACQNATPSQTSFIPPPIAKIRPPEVHREVVRTAWTFQASEAACMAHAFGPHMGLAVIVTRTGPMHLSITLRDALAAELTKRVSIRFAGQAGHWNLRATRARHGIDIALPLDDVALSRVLVLLSGGTLDIGNVSQGVPSMRLPVAGDAGRSWFNCARDQLI